MLLVRKGGWSTGHVLGTSLQQSLFVERNQMVADRRMRFLFQMYAPSVEKPWGMQGLRKTLSPQKPAEA